MNTTVARLGARIREHVEATAGKAYGEEVTRRIREGSGYVMNPRAERLILQDWRFAYLYSRNFLQGRWPELEKAMADAPAATDPSVIRCVFNYAKYVCQGRLPAAEKHIANCPLASVDYALDILKSAWRDTTEEGRLANDTISRHPTAASAYRMRM